jgi:hypothetical protein
MGWKRLGGGVGDSRGGNLGRGGKGRGVAVRFLGGGVGV